MNLLRKGMRGGDVIALQKLLNKAGYATVADGIFGNQTDWDVRNFQRKKGLTVDGIVGPITRSKLDTDWGFLENVKRSAPATDFIKHLIRVAESFEGVRETSENRGPHIDQWLAELGINSPAAWCMAFVQGVFRQTALERGVSDPLKPDTAGVLDLWNRVPKGWRVPFDEGRAGDIMIMDHGGGKGHTGIVTGYKDGMYITIEGNTNDDGSRDGDCVADKYRKKYSNKQLKGFVRVPVDGL